MKEASIEYACARCGFKLDDMFPYADEKELGEAVWKFCPKCGERIKIKKLETWQAPAYRYGE